MKMESSLEAKLLNLFVQLPYLSDFPIEDDTVLQKLQSTLQGLIDCKEDSLAWCEEIGLISFVTSSLEEEFIENDKNFALVSFALHCLSSLVKNEQRFMSFYQEKVILNFRRSYPYLYENMSSLSNAIRVVESLICHQAGLSWVTTNDVWEKLLLRSLDCQNIFIKKSCTIAITSIILKTEDKEKYTSYIQDLEMILHGARKAEAEFQKVSEKDIPDEFSAACIVARLSSNTQTILGVFQNLLIEALGKKCIYTPLKSVFELISKLLFHHNLNVSSQGVIIFFKLLLLGIIHKFQDVSFQSNTVQQCHIDSVTSDILHLLRCVLTRDFHQEFLISLFEFHKYWNVMCKNMCKDTASKVSSYTSILLIIMKMQILPFRTICRKYLMDGDQDRRMFEERFETWKMDVLQHSVISDEHKIKLDQLLVLLFDKSSCNLIKENEQCVSYLLSAASAVEYFHPICASSFAQSLIFLIQFKNEETSTLASNPRLYFHAIDILRGLIERYEINWKTYEAELLLPSLCSVVWIPGITTRVKVISLQTIKACIDKCIPPLETRLEHSSGTEMEDIYLKNLGKAVSTSLSDMEWEVRDSALELMMSCMKINKGKCEAFVSWFMKFNFLDHLFQALGDIEPYVQSTTLLVMATIVPVDKIWSKVNEREIKQKALRAIVRSGETCIRHGGTVLLHSLLANVKFRKEEISMFVLPVVLSTVHDPDDNIRTSSIAIIRQYLNMELNSIGIVGENLTSTILLCNRELNLKDKTIGKGLLNVISSFCLNGCFLCAVNCIADKVDAVLLEAVHILKLIDALLKVFGLHTQLYSQLSANKSSVLSPLAVGSESTIPETDIRNSSLDDANPEMECILKMSDLAAITRLKKDSDSSPGKLWWNGEALDPFLEEQEIPKNIQQVTEECVIRGLQRTYDVRMDNDKENYETEIILLLEDIFLVVGSSQIENESRARDCY